MAWVLSCLLSALVLQSGGAGSSLRAVTAEEQGSHCCQPLLWCAFCAGGRAAPYSPRCGPLQCPITSQHVSTNDLLVSSHSRLACCSGSSWRKGQGMGSVILSWTIFPAPLTCTLPELGFASDSTRRAERGAGWKKVRWWLSQSFFPTLVITTSHNIWS